MVDQILYDSLIVISYYSRPRKCQYRHFFNFNYVQNDISDARTSANCPMYFFNKLGTYQWGSVGGHLPVATL